MEKTIRYLINFLAGNSEADFSSIIGYTANQEEFSRYKVVIIPAAFFNADYYGKPSSIPVLPLQQINNIPLLYGTPKLEKIEATLVVHADIIASTYFLVTRYEEWVKPNCRDSHGRFPGKASLPFRAGFIHRPIVDEYSDLLQQWLTECGVTVPHKKEGIAKLFLTHDVDQISHYRCLKGLAGSLLQNKFGKALKSYFGKIENDPLFTFPFLFETNSSFSTNTGIPTESVFFFKSLIHYLPEDKPYYDLFSKDAQYLLHLCHLNKAEIGVHASYFSGDNPEIISHEKDQLELAYGNFIHYNRHHYLRTKEPADMTELINAGITDDFTLGYADVAGFRLGTCRSIKWINLPNKELSDLTLHPLIIMDRTLSDNRYMNMSFSDALNYCKQLIDKVHTHHGEVVLLWHNQSLVQTEAFNHGKLYADLLHYITSISKQ